MASELLLVREGNKLAAVEPTSLELIEAMGRDEVVTATIRRTRNPGHHRKFFALMKVVFDAQSRYATSTQLLNVLKMAVGHGEFMEVVKGKPIFIPASISFAKLDQGNFEDFYKKVVDVVVTKILPGVARTDLEEQVNEILGN